MCGAWSFDAESKICYLHSVNSCCNQINKSIKAETFISGFVCPYCWSTKNDCPCPEKELRTGIETQFASADSLVQHGSATVSKNQSQGDYKGAPESRVLFSYTSFGAIYHRQFWPNFVIISIDWAI